MNNLATTTQGSLSKIENVLMKGDLSSLNEEQRLVYYRQVCESLGLNYLTRPFDYITLNGKLTLYARKDCTDQLRKTHNVSLNITSREKIDDVYIVTVKAKTPDGREDESTGVVTIGHLKGEALANAMMKAETKAKRRATLSFCGLGMLDETETEFQTKKEREIPQEATVRIQDMKKPSPAQLSQLFTLAQTYNVSNEKLKEYVQKEIGVSSSKDLSLDQYSLLCREIEDGKLTQPVVQPKEEEKPTPEKKEMPWEKYLDDPNYVK